MFARGVDDEAHLVEAARHHKIVDNAAFLVEEERVAHT